MPRSSRTLRRWAALALLASSTSVVSFMGCTVTSTSTQPEVTPETPTTPTPPGTVQTTAPPTDPAPTAAPTQLPELPGPTPAGDWVKPNPKGKADGDACKKPDDCKSGVCEGLGCDSGAKCVAANRMCTRDLRTYCGCDDKDFGGSGTCPGRPYKKAGSCK